MGEGTFTYKTDTPVTVHAVMDSWHIVASVGLDLYDQRSTVWNVSDGKMPAMKILESWIRPWKGELVVGQVMALSGDHVLCRTANGFEFRVAMSHVIAGKVQILEKEDLYSEGRFGPPHRNIRLTEKALLS